MTAPSAIDLTPAQAADLIHSELIQAAEALQTGDLDAALDGYVRALGLALQLGPAPTEQVLTSVLQAARELAHQGDVEGLSALGPALVGLTTQVCEAGALPPTPVMEAWAIVSADLGTLIGQVGLTLALPFGHRPGMADKARTRATHLDNATDGLLALTAWIDEAMPISPRQNAEPC